jgi:hypothetical protein
MTGLPAELRIDAWPGRTAQGSLDPQAASWGLGGTLPHSQVPLDLGAVADPLRWASPDVGYGVLLADPTPKQGSAGKAAGEDAPVAVRRLLAARPNTVLLRWSPDLAPKQDYRFVRRYFPDGSFRGLQIGLAPIGVAPESLPRYVVIIGGPEVIPWPVQYSFGTRHAVGRLPFTDERLDHYIDAMLGDWPDADLDVRAPLLWTVDIPGDITAEMRVIIADPLAEKLTDPQLPRFEHLVGAGATGPALTTRLAAARPALVVTSSHGLTDIGPGLGAALGVPVDAGHDPVPITELDAAMPPGAIWHAQACCSAGSEGPSKYRGLLAPGSTAASVVDAVAELGPTVAPAALRLLGRPRPVRAVVGHVEPTFDWTLRVKETGQGLGHDLVRALSTNLFAGQPIGFAFSEYRTGVGVLHSQWADIRAAVADGDISRRPVLTRLRLSALDRQSMVLLGDPTVTLPPLAGAP